MQFTALRLTGFKSFVEPTELKIEPGLTGVVGPNGCGKSNLLEAIRWVMGESSPKSMRGGGMDDVIFAGTLSRPAREFAEVTLVGKREGAPLSGIGSAADEGDGFEVVRRIERGTGSAYRVNGRDVRAKDVALIFADAATGAHSPALVSQGRIAAVIAAKPAERRAMLEEAAGIAGLHVRRKDAEQKLRATEANLARLGDLLADMDARAQALRRQARAAERYTRLTDEIRIAEARMIFSRWREAAAASDQARTAKETCAAAVADAQSALEQASATHAETQARLAGVRAMMERLRATGHGIAQDLAQRRGELATLERRQADLAAMLDQVAADEAQEGSLAQAAADAIATLQQAIGTHRDALAAGEARLPPLAQASADAAAALRDAEVALAQQRSLAANEAAERRIAQAAAASAADVVRQSEAERDKAAAAIAALGDGAAQAGALAAARERADALAEASAARAAARTTAQEAEAAAQQAARQSAAAHAEAEATAAALASEATALRASLADVAAADRLIDHVQVMPGYEAAFAAALGEEAGAGFGDETDHGWRGAAPLADDPALPPGVPALADFVRAPDVLLRRLRQIGVVVADDGIPLAAGQRLVTRDGRMRRWDGFASSGQGAATADRLIRINRLADIEPALAAAEAALSAALAAKGEAAQHLDAARAAMAAAEAAHGRVIEDHRAALRDIDRAEAAAAAHEAQLALLSGQHSALAERAAQAQAALHAAEAALAALPEAHGAETLLAALAAEAEQARTAQALARQAEEEVHGALAVAREALAVAEADRRGWTARAGEAVRRIEEMRRRRASLLAEQEALTTQPDALRNAVTRLEAEREANAAELDARAAEERAATIDASASDALLNAAREKLSSAREARAGAEARAEAAELRRIEMGRISGERFECPPPLLPEKLGFDADALASMGEESARHERLMAERERIGPVNLVAGQELAELDAQHATSQAEAEELQQAVNRLRGSIGSLNREGRERLRAAFTAVNDHFQRLFTTLFDGGQAHLALIDSDDPLEAGLEIYAQPPGKKLAALTLLSGGEQALTAIALVFALFLTNPAPICVLDEVDAPLDDANIERFCDLLDRMVGETRTRYLIVTHNAVTMARMHRLFGVTMVERGISRLVSVDLGSAEHLLAAE